MMGFSMLEKSIMYTLYAGSGYHNSEIFMMGFHYLSFVRRLKKKNSACIVSLYFKAPAYNTAPGLNNVSGL